MHKKLNKKITEYLFVYGTLRRRFSTKMSDLLSRRCEYIADACMQGKLYEIAGYPGAIISGDAKDKVYGELYKIMDSSELLPVLDEHEECTDRFPEPHEYIRVKLPVNPVGGDVVTAWVYIYNRDVSNLLPVTSGHYTDSSND